MNSSLFNCPCDQSSTFQFSSIVPEEGNVALHRHHVRSRALVACVKLKQHRSSNRMAQFCYSYKSSHNRQWRLAMLQPCTVHEERASGYFQAEISVSSPRKCFIFIIKEKSFLDQSITTTKKQFEKSSLERASHQHTVLCQTSYQLLQIPRLLGTQ